MTGLNLDTIERADVMDYLRGLPDACVNLVCTSPPYFGLRDYGVSGQIGLEATPAAYVARMVDVFREVKRVLRSDGNVYVNLGDSYNNSPKGNSDNASSGLNGAKTSARYSERLLKKDNRVSKVQADLPMKSLIGVPWRFAIAMQDDGWLLREDIVWQKPNPMPESVRDRCTRSHEYIFHFTKGPRYWYDAQAVAEGRTEASIKLNATEVIYTKFSPYAPNDRNDSERARMGAPMGNLRNRRSVWTINPANFREAHFATFPEDIPEICIKAACPEGGVVLDPFAGAGTVGLVAKKLNRRYIGCDLNAEYVKMATDRINGISYTLFSLMEVTGD
jgi:DNA modification methylase